MKRCQCVSVNGTESLGLPIAIQREEMILRRRDSRGKTRNVSPRRPLILLSDVFSIRRQIYTGSLKYSTFTNISCAKHFEISLAPLRDWTIATVKSGNVHKNCEIFSRSTYFAEIINVFKRSFVRYVNKPCYFGIGFDACYMLKTLRCTLIFY